LEIFKNTGTFHADKMYINASLQDGTYHFFCIEDLSDNACYDAFFFQCKAPDLQSALAEYYDFIPSSLRALCKVTEFYFQGKLVLTLPPTL